MRRRLRLIVLVLVAVAVGTGVVVRWRMKDRDSGPRTVEVKKGDVVLLVKEAGTVEARRQVQVKSQVAGQVVKLLVEEGDGVKEGDLIAVLDPTELRREVERTEAQIAGAKAAVLQARSSRESTTRQVDAGIESAGEAVEQARSRLKQARERAASQSVVSRTAVEQADAALRSAQENLSLEQQAGSRQRVAEAQSAYDQAQANLTKAEKELERAEGLVAEGYIAASEVDEARRSVEVAQAQFNSAQERLSTVEKEAGARERALKAAVDEAQAALKAAQARGSEATVAEAEVEAAQAALRQAEAGHKEALSRRWQVEVAAREVEKAEANLRQLESGAEQARVRLSYTTVRAPMDGLVVKRHVEPGELIMSGVASFAAGTPIVTIADLSEMLVKVGLNEVDAPKVKVGQKAEVSSDALKGRVFHGVVSAVAPMAERDQQGGGQVAKFEVEVTLLSNDPELRPGVSANVDIVVAERRQVVYLPPEAVQEKGGRETVTVVGAGMKQEREVKLGLKTVDRVEVVSGVKEGEQVETPSGALMGRKKIPMERAIEGHRRRA